MSSYFEVMNSQRAKKPFSIHFPFEFKNQASRARPQVASPFLFLMTLGDLAFILEGPCAENGQQAPTSPATFGSEKITRTGKEESHGEKQVVSEVPKAADKAPEEEEVSPRGHTMVQQQFVYDHAIFDLSRSCCTFHPVFGGTHAHCRWILAVFLHFLLQERSASNGVHLGRRI